MSGTNTADLMTILQLPPDQLAELTSSMEKNILNGVILKNKKIFNLFMLKQSFLLSSVNLTPFFFDERSSPELTLVFHPIGKHPHNCSLKQQTCFWS